MSDRVADEMKQRLAEAFDNRPIQFRTGIFDGKCNFFAQCNRDVADDMLKSATGGAHRDQTQSLQLRLESRGNLLQAARAALRGLAKSFEAVEQFGPRAESPSVAPFLALSKQRRKVLAKHFKLILPHAQGRRRVMELLTQPQYVVKFLIGNAYYGRYTRRG